MAMVDCRHFNGYKPCGRNAVCDDSCPALERAGARVLLVHLGALGAVVRSTALLAPLRRKFPRAHLTWVTDAPADRLLKGHPGIDRVLTTSDADLLSLSALEFDVALVVDKSLKAAGVLARTRADLHFGFRVDARTGAILPATAAADELWRLGLDDHAKFFVNRKPEIRLATEALELGPWRGDDYHLPLSAAEERLRDERKRQWSRSGALPVIGLNTGCSNVIAAKKLTVEAHRDLIRRFEGVGRVVLLGGPEDTVRNERISFGMDVVSSPTERGLRDGYVSVAACDVVVTGDSLGMHLAIAAGVWTVAWFGPTCAHEIELYGRGEAVLSKAPCAPCWKRVCDKTPMCYDQVDLSEIVAAAKRGLVRDRGTEKSTEKSQPCQSAMTESATDAPCSSSSRPPSSAISS